MNQGHIKVGRNEGKPLMNVDGRKGEVDRGDLIELGV